MVCRGMDMRGAFFTLVVASIGVASSALAGPNLLVNPGAESGAPGQVIPGWIVNGNFEVVSYSAGGGFPLLTDPGAPSRGGNFFAGGSSNSLSSASQNVPLGGFAGAIDAGGQFYTLSGWIGGFSSQDDHAEVSASFRDAGGAQIGFGLIGGVLAAQRGSSTGMLFRTVGGAIPKFTRSVVITITMTREAGSYNDGYADELSFSLGNSCPCDLNGDGLVEDSDFSLFVVAYDKLDCADPTMPVGCPADFNGDGVVEDTDFSIFVLAYDALICP